MDGCTFQCFILHRNCVWSPNRFSSRLGCHWYAHNDKYSSSLLQSVNFKNLWHACIRFYLPFNRRMLVPARISLWDDWNYALWKHANNHCSGHSSFNGISYEVKRDPSQRLLPVLAGWSVFLSSQWCPLQPIHFIIFYHPSFVWIYHWHLLLKAVFIGNMEEVHISWKMHS